MSTSRPIGIVGVGELGTVVANALLGDGRQAIGYDPHPAAVERMTDLGIEPADSPAALGAACDLVIVTVATADQSTAAISGPEGVFTTMVQGTVVLHATIDPATSIAIGKERPSGVTFVDAPVSVRRSDPPTFMAFLGTEAPLDDELRAVLLTYCHQVAEVGAVGAGQVAKIANNVMSLANTAILAEAFRLAQAYDIPTDRMRELAAQGSGNSHALATWTTRASLYTEPGDPRRRALARKDLVAALALAEQAGFTLPVTAAALGELRD
ncbi:NAD(P)-dependent oxidoreductase [Pseudonocardia kujensis]|uniref:NAD(P)-dependent oxidoreductase n=1 Tax=Pseudonocardia kujensis TaxID=1128675 RepID=UPI001E60FBE5|nr:NAD(P)-dependent oxidoreductase [Pseudonocardia kujensis]MCE0763550.1 NAD(P)-dependent oxidoreductase [Pseudonocardia kujensis]